MLVAPNTGHLFKVNLDIRLEAPMVKRRKFTAQFKARVVLQMFLDGKSLAQARIRDKRFSLVSLEA